jgi:hypothetical protein
MSNQAAPRSAGPSQSEAAVTVPSYVVNPMDTAFFPKWFAHETELISHYFHARLPDQFDAILHYDHTRAVEPLERSAEWQAGEVEETFPSGL